MRDRTMFWLGVTVVVTVIVVFLNLDLFSSDFEYPEGVTRFLSWQGEEDVRGLELRQGLDLQGGLQVLLEADPPRGQEIVESETLAKAASVIQNRVDALGVTEPLVQTQGEDKIVVELPGVEDPDLAVRTIGDTARLEFIYAADGSGAFQGAQVNTTHPVFYREIRRAIDEGTIDPNRANPFLGDPLNPIPELAPEGASSDVGDDEVVLEDEEPEGASDGEAADDDAADDEAADDDAAGDDAADDEAAGDDAADDEAAGDDEEEPGGLEMIFPTVIDGEFVQDAGGGIDQFTGQPVVTFQLNREGGIRMREFSGEHVGEIMAITLDGEVVSAPALRDAIGADGQISGDFTQEQVDTLAVQINSGALPVALNVVGQTKVGPTLGAEAVQSAIAGGVVGLVAVMLFMLLYYRMPGLMADVALLLYALITLAIFRLMPVTLTLAGIAGFVLSIGMAVDANILIFERTKEELREGRRVKTATEIGFLRAWPSIRDSNISTLITCGILFWFGNQFGASIVKGFAVTLAIGVLVSLFTAITVTRTLLNLSGRWVVREDRSKSVLEDRRLRALFGF